MDHEKRHIDDQFLEARRKATEELALLEQRSSLSARDLVRKAMLLQLEYSAGGTAAEVEESLKAALALDDHCIEAHIELGHFYYSVLDDAVRGKAAFARAIEILSVLNRAALGGILDCELELVSGQSQEALSAAYAAKLLGSC